MRFNMWCAISSRWRLTSKCTNQILMFDSHCLLQESSWGTEALWFLRWPWIWQQDQQHAGTLATHQLSLSLFLVPPHPLSPLGPVVLEISPVKGNCFPSPGVLISPCEVCVLWFGAKQYEWKWNESSVQDWLWIDWPSASSFHWFVFRLSFWVMDRRLNSRPKCPPLKTLSCTMWCVVRLHVLCVCTCVPI